MYMNFDTSVQVMDRLTASWLNGLRSESVVKYRQHGWIIIYLYRLINIDRFST